MENGTFTDFMVRAMAGQDDVQSAFIVMRKADGTIGYKCFNQQVADTLGLLRFAALSVENDLVQGWKQD